MYSYGPEISKSHHSSCMTPTVWREKNTAMSPVGFGTKNNCPGEGQQQFTQLTDNSDIFTKAQ
jgi:hypothetical protein